MANGASATLNVTATVLASVRKLMRHPLFSIKNPNKVRALIGTFAMANPVNFNRPDGRGYELVEALRGRESLRVPQQDRERLEARRVASERAA